LTLSQSTSAKDFVTSLKKAASTRVIVASRPRRVIISPTILDTTTLLSEPWDLLLLLLPPNPREPLFPPTLASQITKEYQIKVGIPSKLLNSYPERDAKLKREARGVPLTGSLDNLSTESTGENLEVSGDLLRFMNEFSAVYDKPVTMLNLLHFQRPDGKENYFKYGQVCTVPPSLFPDFGIVPVHSVAPNLTTMYDRASPPSPRNAAETPNSSATSSSLRRRRTRIREVPMIGRSRSGGMRFRSCIIRPSGTFVICLLPRIIRRLIGSIGLQ
jgi:hypothetical protein